MPHRVLLSSYHVMALYRHLLKLYPIKKINLGTNCTQFQLAGRYEFYFHKRLIPVLSSVYGSQARKTISWNF